MEPVKIGQVLCCGKCGVELKVIKDCASTCTCSIVCCGQPLKVKQTQAEEGAAT